MLFYKLIERYDNSKLINEHQSTIPKHVFYFKYVMNKSDPKLNEYTSFT